jgi:hypothetical protein
LFFAITTPSDEDIGKLSDTRKNNILRWLYFYKMVEDQKFPYLQGGLIFKKHSHDRTLTSSVQLCNITYNKGSEIGID